MSTTIKTQTEYQVNGDEEVYRTLISEREYDEFGNLILEIQYFSSGEIYTEHAFTFEAHLLIQERMWNENGDCTIIDFQYDEAHRLIYKSTTFSDNSKTFEKRAFTSNQEIIQQFDEADQLTGRQVLTYNKEHELIREETFIFNGLAEKDEYRYNRKGELAEVIRENYQEQTKYFETYQFTDREHFMVRKDETGEILYADKSVYEGDKLIEKIIEYHHWSDNNSICKYVYDENDNLQKETHFDFEGHMIFDAIYTYNENQDIIKTVVVKASGLNNYEKGYLDEQIITEYELVYF